MSKNRFWWKSLSLMLLGAALMNGAMTSEALAQCGKLKRALAQSEAIYSVAYSPDGKTIASAGGKSVRIWDASSGAIKKLLKDRSSIRVVAYASNGRWLASGGREGVTLWNSRTGKPIKKFKTTSEVFSLSFSRDSQFLFTASATATARFPAQNGDGVRLVTTSNTSPHDYAIPTSYSFFQTEENMFRPISTSYGAVQRWNTATGVSKALEIGSYAPMIVQISPDGKKLALQGQDRVLLVNPQTGAESGFFEADGWQGWVRSIAFSRDQKLVAASATTEGNTVYIWDTATRKPRFGLYHDDVRTLAFSSNGRFLATGSRDGYVRIWHTRSGTLRQTIKHNGSIESLLFSPDGKTMVCAGGTNIRLWHFNPQA